MLDVGQANLKVEERPEADWRRGDDRFACRKFGAFADLLLWIGFSRFALDVQYYGV